MTDLNEKLAGLAPKALLTIYNGLAATIPGMTPCARFSDKQSALARTQKLLAVVLEREEAGDVDAEFAGRAAAIVEGREFVKPMTRVEEAAAVARDAVLSNRNGGREVTATEQALDAAALKSQIVNPAVEVKAKSATGRKPGTKIILKGNKEVRAQLTAAAQKLGGTRLVPVGFDSYSAFLNGFDLNAERMGDTIIEFYAVKGSERQPGSVQLVVRGSDRAISVVASNKVEVR